jgi:hypothetical protein
MVPSRSYGFYYIICIQTSQVQFYTGADPGFQVRGAHLKKLHRAEGGAKIFEVEMSSACTGELAFKSCKRAPCLESSSSLIRSFTNTKYSLVDKTCYVDEKKLSFFGRI